MNYEIGTFPCKTGFMRWARLAGPEPSRGCVLICMGWGEWLEKYTPIAAQFHQRGFEVVVMERRGQGLSSRFLDNRLKSWLPDYKDLMEDFEAFYAHYFAGENMPLLLGGHSMGAHLLLRWYVEKAPPENIRGLILMSPMQRVNTAPFPYPVAELIASCAMALGLGKSFAPGQADYDSVLVPFAENVITRDEARYQAMVLALRDNPLLKCGGITFGWLQAAFNSAKALQKRLRGGAPPGPYLVLGAENDPLVDTAAIKEIAAYLPHCESKFFPDAAHELLQEKDGIRQKVWAAIDAFIAQNFPVA